MPFDFARARTNMVDGQIRPNKVTDVRILDAFESVARELFVPPALREAAYSEQELSMPLGRCLLAPMTLARMLESLKLRPTDRVLDVAPATGYSTVVLSRLVQAVIGLEADSGLAAAAAEMVKAQGAMNAQVVHGPISLGAKQYAPYDAVLVNGAMAEVPRTLFYQLAEGGRLVAVVVGGSTDGAPGHVTLFTKLHGMISERVIFEASASYVPGFVPAEAFAL